MQELVDKQATLKKMCELCGNRCEKFEEAMRTTHLDFVTYKCSNYRFLSEQPTIEPEVRHGRWVDKGDYAVCSECGGHSGTQYDGVEPIPWMTQYCQHCGAKMRVGE